MSLLPAVRSINILPYDHIIDSDHRGILLEIDADIMSIRGTQIQQHPSRKLTLGSPRKIGKYLAEFKRQCKEHRILENVIQLVKSFATFPNKMNENIQKYEKISGQIMKIQLNAEIKCAKNTPHYPWSPAMAQAGREVSFWRSVQRNYSDTEQYMKYIKQKGQLRNINIPEPLDRLTLSMKVRADKNHLKKIQTNARTLRETHLMELAEYYSNIKQQPQSVIVKQIKQREKMKGMFNKISSQLKKENGTAYIHSPLEIMRRCSPRQKRSMTPFFLTLKLSLRKPTIYR